MITENFGEIQNIIKQELWRDASAIYQRDRHIKKKYGLDYNQYEELLKKQKYCCAICGRHETEFNRKLAVDHDHKTGEIFGLLCTFCNHYLIGRNRRVAFYLNAAKYLRKGTGLFIPKKIKYVRKRRTRLETSHEKRLSKKSSSL